MRPLGAVLLACAAACHAAPYERGGVDHIVLMWLEDPGDEDAATRLEQAARDFVGQIPGLLSVDVGRPLLGDGSVDDSYDMAFVMNFVDRAALEAYETHPAHVRAVEQLLRPSVRRLQIYDVLLR